MNYNRRPETGLRARPILNTVIILVGLFLVGMTLAERRGDGLRDGILGAVLDIMPMRGEGSGTLVFAAGMAVIAVAAGAHWALGRRERSRSRASLARRQEGGTSDG
ncbi:MAG: hypothetical protein LBK95_04385 [Bifidobacteriaceae bacterium]|jgi:hypothetical protein|nr:hypothetical protein [Bifidobacteriaceae bacterium]